MLELCNNMLKRSLVKKPANIQFTKEGLEKVQKEYDELKLRRVDAVKELRIASAMGDRSENAAYKVGRQKVNEIDRQIRHLGKLVRYGVVEEREFTGRVDIGCKVLANDGKKNCEYTIVGGYESDLMQGKLSCFSPIGKAFMGKKVDEYVQVHAPVGVLTFKILEVSLA